MINFSDIIKGKFLEEFTAISVSEMLIAITLSFVLSLFIVCIYRKTFTGVCFNRSFAACLIMISMVTAVVIQVITSNVVLSLGMVGALSIVRFRTAVKEPADTAFLFWAIATGIICGAGYVTISIVATALLGLLFMATYIFGQSIKSDSYMIIVRYSTESDVESRVTGLRGYQLKNKSMSGNFTELVAEVRLRDRDMAELEAMRNIPGVHEVSVMRSVTGSVL